ncbi:MAG: hypothetical protein K6C32_03145 [Bacilli bacterium]|nr:hypothetical protein [Bacilli bacterium]
MKKVTFFMASLLALTTLAACGGRNTGADKYDENGYLYLRIKNVWFENWKGEDKYTEYLNKKFGIHVVPSNYEYDGWDGEVNTAINGNNLTDAIHFNLKAYNFGTTYEKWVNTYMLKALPDDMSKWPNIESLLGKISNIDALKINGKLYGIPIINDLDRPNKDFSNFTYVYRRDRIKEIDEAKLAENPNYKPVYREGDVYTWDEFIRLCNAFKTYKTSNQNAVLVDERWGFPSITNFYKNVPHCYDKDASGKAINAFTSDAYIEGLEKSKEFVDQLFYSQDQFNFADNKAKEDYCGGKADIFYDNFSLSNYITFRQKFKKNNKNVDLDDGTAFLKIKGPDGKFSLEGTENWFSMTMFNADISNKKLEKMLDLIDYLLSEEGTRLAIYGIEGYDYSIVDGEVVLSDLGWEKTEDGTYGPKTNGAKFLRYMASLGNETKSYDPYTEMDAYTILNNWSLEMEHAKENGELRIFKEPPEIDWMSTPTKNDKTEGLLADANVNASKYCFGKFKDINAYVAEFAKDKNWAKVLGEINEKLGK